jgi:hypothetical protein
LIKLSGAVPALIFALAAAASAAEPQTQQYPPLSEYMMPHVAEIAMAKSAAPESITSHATVKVLGSSGYTVAVTGDNGFTCLVMRGWAAPTYTPAQLRGIVYDAKVRAPICFDPVASRAVMPYYELRTQLGLQGQSPDQIAHGVQSAYDTGRLPKRDAVSFAYMWSADQYLGPGAGHWHPHLMIFAPYYDNAKLGGNPFGGPLPGLSDDAGTPFAVVVVPLDHELFIKTSRR